MDKSARALRSVINSFLLSSWTLCVHFTYLLASLYLMCSFCHTLLHFHLSYEHLHHFFLAHSHSLHVFSDPYYYSTTLDVFDRPTLPFKISFYLYMCWDGIDVGPINPMMALESLITSSLSPTNLCLNWFIGGMVAGGALAIKLKDKIELVNIWDTYYRKIQWI